MNNPSDYTLRELISHLIDNNTLTETHTEYNCACGSVSIQRHYLRKHLATKKHLKWINGPAALPTPPQVEGVVEEEKDDCSICYELRDSFYTCSTCRNKHCMDCHPKMNTCPFCRTRFRVQRPRERRARSPVPMYNTPTPIRTNHLSIHEQIKMFIDLYNSTRTVREGRIIKDVFRQFICYEFERMINHGENVSWYDDAYDIYNHM